MAKRNKPSTTPVIESTVDGASAIESVTNDAGTSEVSNEIQPTVAMVSEVVTDALNTTVQVAEAAATVSKASIARAIFNEALAAQQATGIPMVRKTILDRFQKEAGLTKNGSTTYYQQFREKANLVVKRVAAAVATPTGDASASTEQPA